MNVAGGVWPLLHIGSFEVVFGPLHRPTLLLLGAVEIVNAGGTTAAARTATEVLEPIAYVYLNPDCLTTRFKEAMAGRTSKPDELASRARRFLGTAPDGSKLFPSARRDGTSRHYRRHPHTYCDWTHFQALIAGGINTTPTANLEAHRTGSHYVAIVGAGDPACRTIDSPSARWKTDQPDSP